jgi:hypothetical protein
MYVSIVSGMAGNESVYLPGLVMDRQGLNECVWGEGVLVCVLVLAGMCGKG